MNTPASGSSSNASGLTSVPFTHFSSIDSSLGPDNAATSTFAGSYMGILETDSATAATVSKIDNSGVTYSESFNSTFSIISWTETDSGFGGGNS